MHFADELLDVEKLNVPKKSAEPGKRELDMAKTLVENMSAEWDAKKYKDDYRDALLEVIEEKVEAGGKEIEEKPKPKKPSPKVIDLVAVLQQSLAQARGDEKKKRSHRRSKTNGRKAA
jgi:DNA end-binding protein Ku